MDIVETLLLSLHDASETNAAPAAAKINFFILIFT